MIDKFCTRAVKTEYVEVRVTFTSERDSEEVQNKLLDIKMYAKFQEIVDYLNEWEKWKLTITEVSVEEMSHNPRSGYIWRPERDVDSAWAWQ